MKTLWDFIVKYEVWFLLLIIYGTVWYWGPDLLGRLGDAIGVIAIVRCAYLPMFKNWRDGVS